MGDIDMEGSFLSKTLVINRILGTKHFMKDSSRWVVHDDKKSECWKCTQHILTLFFWTPRIGAATSDKDLIKTKYYKDKLEGLRDMSDQAMNSSSTPLFASSFNGWHYENMLDVVPYCMKNDLDPPNFEEECITDGIVRIGRNGKLTND